MKRTRVYEGFFSVTSSNLCFKPFRSDHGTTVRSPMGKGLAVGPTDTSQLESSMINVWVY
jgi:hypothetical protein